MKVVTVVFALLGCGSVRQSALVTDGGGSDVVAEKATGGDERPVEEREEVRADAAGGGTNVDAVVADANGSDGAADVAETWLPDGPPDTGVVGTMPEAPPVDVISGTWNYWFSPNKGHGQMVLKLTGNAVSGTYDILGYGPDGNKGGSGTVAGTFDADVLALVFEGTAMATASGKVALSGQRQRIDAGSCVLPYGAFMFTAEHF